MAGAGVLNSDGSWGWRPMHLSVRVGDQIRRKNTSPNPAHASKERFPEPRYINTPQHERANHEQRNTPRPLPRHLSNPTTLG